MNALIAGIIIKTTYRMREGAKNGIISLFRSFLIIPTPPINARLSSKHHASDKKIIIPLLEMMGTHHL